MTTRRQLIEVAGVPVEVVHKDIKNLHIGVYPPAGRVRVAAPLRLGHEAVRLAVVSRLGWIRRRQSDFEHQDRQSQREFVTGESHYFQGRRYRLNVVEQDGSPSVTLLNNRTMRLRIRPGSGIAERETTVAGWYRRRLRELIPPLIEKWQSRAGVQISEVGIRRMKTRWGSCNAAARRIWLNLELAKKPRTCLEYIFVHEMVHVLERHHNERFREHLDALMPDWEWRRQDGLHWRTKTGSTEWSPPSIDRRSKCVDGDLHSGEAP